MTITTETGTFLPVPFTAPLVLPSPYGLYGATTWPTDTEPPRWLAAGVLVRTQNFDGLNAAGVWAASWCADPDDLGNDDIKDGQRAADLDPFEAVTVWAYDECGLTEPSQAEVRKRATQSLKINEQQMVEREFAARLLADTSDVAVNDIVEAVSKLEAAFSQAGMVGVIHASTQWAAYAAQAQLLKVNGSNYSTPLGNRWAFGGGYVDGLGNTLVGTSPLFGWKTEPDVRGTIKAENNLFAVVAERSVAIAYEHAYTAVTIG